MEAKFLVRCILVDMLSSLALDSRPVPSCVSSRHGSNLSLHLQNWKCCQHSLTPKFPYLMGRSIQKDLELLSLLNLGSIVSRSFRPLGVYVLHGLNSPKGDKK